jgi:hypothetical protein
MTARWSPGVPLHPGHAPTGTVPPTSALPVREPLAWPAIVHEAQFTESAWRQPRPPRLPSIVGSPAPTLLLPGTALGLPGPTADVGCPMPQPGGPLSDGEIARPAVAGRPTAADGPLKDRSFRG